MTERFEIFPQNVAKDGTLIIIQKGLKLYNISDVVDLLNEHEEKEQLKKIVNNQQVEIDYLAHVNSEFKEENKKLKQQLYYIDKLINDLSSEEMCRQYDEIIGDFE